MTEPNQQQAEPGTVVEPAVDPDSAGAEPAAEPAAETGTSSAQPQASRTAPAEDTVTPRPATG
jgi:hypothetical protein